jgi:hypothetical protein
MSRAVLAVFDTAAGLTAAAQAARAERYTVADAFSPFPLPGLDGPPVSTRAIGWAAGAGGLLVAAAMFGLQAWSAAFGYPIDAGGRPLFSWPTFLLASFEIGVLAAAVSALVAFLYAAGLPRLHHPAFDIEGFERTSQDRFLLTLARPRLDDRREALFALLSQGGALDVREVEL